MVYSTVLDDLKTLLDAGSYGSLTATFKIKANTNALNEPEIYEPRLYRDGSSPILTTNKVVGILEKDVVTRTVRSWQGADIKRYDGTLSLFSISWNNLADFIEDILKVGTDLKTSHLSFSEPPILDDAEDANFFSAEMRWGWEKIVKHG